MLKHYLIIAWRNLRKERFFTVLNLLGLCTGVCCALLIYLWVHDELQVDRFHDKKDRLFQVLNNYNRPAGTETTEHTPGLLASSLATELPEVEYAVPVVPASPEKKGIVVAGDKKLEAANQFAGRDFFKAFSFSLLEGSPEHVLDDPHSVVLSDELALTLFGNTTDLVGKTINWQQKDYNGPYRIAGVFKKPPAHSTMQFDVLFSYDLFLSNNKKLLDWRNNDPYTYVVLREGTSATAFNKLIAGFIKSKNVEAKQTLFAQLYGDRYLYGQYENGVPSGGRMQYVRLFSLIAVFILLIACINFMNLSTARASRRMKEVGMKKVMGASRWSLIAQYLGESLVLTFFAVVMAFVLTLLLLPAFNTVTGKDMRFPFEAGPLLFTIALTLLTGIVAGSYPAFYLSRFKPVLTLKGKLSQQTGGLLLRKGLVVFQFVLGCVFIVAVVVVYRQMKLVQTKNLGYHREQVVYFDMAGVVFDDKEAYKPGGLFETTLGSFVARVKQEPGVVYAANFRHNITNRNGGTTDISWPGKSPDVTMDITDLSVGFGFIETMGLQLAAGRAYSPAYGTEQSNVIFNEVAIEQMGLKDPIGKVVHLWGSDRTIVGVVKNFHFQSLHEVMKPCFLELNQRASKVAVRLAPGQESATLQRIAALYKQVNNGLPISYHFLEDDYQTLYVSEERVATLSKYFAGMAIFISCLGLLGLATFTAQRRQKEIGIRKVAGATVQHIVAMLSTEFLKLVLLAAMIAFPLSWWMMNEWLHGFVYRIEIGAATFAIAGAAVLLLTVLATGFQAVRAALVNPVKSLRSE